MHKKVFAQIYNPSKRLTTREMFLVEYNEETAPVFGAVKEVSTKEEGPYYIVYKPDDVMIMEKFRCS